MDSAVRQEIKSALNAFNNVIQSYGRMQNVLSMKLSNMLNAAKQVLQSASVMTMPETKSAILDAFSKMLDNIIMHALAYEELLDNSSAEIASFKNSMQSSVEIDKLLNALDEDGSHSVVECVDAGCSDAQHANKAKKRVKCKTAP